MARSEINFLINKPIEAAWRHYTLAQLDRDGYAKLAADVGWAGTTASASDNVRVGSKAPL